MLGKLVAAGALQRETVEHEVDEGPELLRADSSRNSPFRCASSMRARFAGATSFCLVAGQVLERWGIVPLFTAVVVGITFSAILFAGITWRYDGGEPASELAVT